MRYYECVICKARPQTPYRKYCAEHEAVGRENTRQATIARLKRQWREWKERGINPTSDNGAGERRGKKIAVSNREKPRRKRRV